MCYLRAFHSSGNLVITSWVAKTEPTNSRISKVADWLHQFGSWEQVYKLFDRPKSSSGEKFTFVVCC